MNLDIRGDRSGDRGPGTRDRGPGGLRDPGPGTRDPRSDWRLGTATGDCDRRLVTGDWRLALYQALIHIRHHEALSSPRSFHQRSVARRSARRMASSVTPSGGGTSSDMRVNTRL